MSKYDPKKIESKWQKYWDKNKTFEVTEDEGKKKFYGLVEFPYPSGAGLHVGHPRPFTAMDVITRKKRMEGFNVLYPMGFDAFGLPTENYAIKTGRPPAEVTAENIANFTRQLKMLGYGFDWSRCVDTTDPKYYKWTQWIFLKLFKHGLAYKKAMPINWCPKDKTGLANEEVVDGKCERCGTPVEKRNKEQWMLSITKYADKLLEGLKHVDYIPQARIQQENWIGRSEGAEIDFKIAQIRNQPVVICHGWDDSSKKHFFPWLKKKLEESNCKVLTFDFPDSSHPIYEKWKQSFEENNIDFENTIFIGHSLGGTFLMKYFTENKNKLYKKLIVIAPPSVDKKIYKNVVSSWFKNGVHEIYKVNVDKTIFICSDNDKYNSIENFKEYAQSLNLPCNIIPGYEHFCTSEFPELLDYVFLKIKVFTTRPDTLFGATYMVVAPEHEIVKSLKSEIENSSEVEKYVEIAKKKSEQDRTAENKEKTGVELKGIKAINPANNEEIPIFVADYVLSTYGTGAIMAVPAHDERDFEFAKKYGLPIKEVVIQKFGNILDLEKPVRKDGICGVIVKDKNVLILYNKETSEYRLPGGGYEKNETVFESLIREISEETGYKNFEIGDYLGELETSFYALAKKENRYKFFKGYLVNLSDEETGMKSTEDDVFENKWVSFEEALKLFESNPVKNNGEDEFLRRAKNEKLRCFLGEGTATNSDFLNGLPTSEAKEKMIAWLEEKNIGKRKVQYKLRDWVFSRQRYWGEPIPLVYCEKCDGWIPLPESELPLTLPEVKKYEPTDTGESPLASVEKWVKTKCPVCGGPARRETDTMPNWAGSSWYFLRYCDPKNDKEFAGMDKLKYWMGAKSPSYQEGVQGGVAGGVDWYNGGMEHTVLHLLYSRFWNEFLYDIGVVPTSEPYQKRTSHGMILAPDGEKMSKSRGNVINPDEMVEKFGTDAFRTYIMFMGPFDQAVSWDTNGLVGVRRFLDKVWNLQQLVIPAKAGIQKLDTLLHQTIKKVSEDIEAMRFNTAISQLMILVNEMSKLEVLSHKSYALCLQLLSPFAPHMAEELWAELGNKESIAKSEWPKYDPELIKDEIITIAVQVNGKLRDTFEVPADIAEEEVKKLALGSENIKKWLEGKEPKKIIYVNGKLVSIVV